MVGATRRARRVAVAVAAALCWSAAALPTATARSGSLATPARTRSAAGGVADWSTVTGTDGRTWFADADGRALGFRGFGNKTDHPATTFSEALLDAGAARGFDLLRLGIWWDELEPVQGTWNEAYLDEVEVVLDRAEARGYRVIIDMHQDRFGPAFGDRGIPVWATRTDGATFVPQETWLLDYLQPAVQNAF
ncbi:MAG TPA: cellulase family glycosylhydrolase, partial [Aquihabitans sp.]|nr:cellulase family glycosylhydrolase [Aquihabitans sp.]